MSTRSASLPRLLLTPLLTGLLTGLLLVGASDHGLALQTAEASPSSASPAASSGSGSRQARRPKKKRRSKATTETPAADPETTDAARPDDAATPDAAAPASGTGAGTGTGTSTGTGTGTSTSTGTPGTAPSSAPSTPTTPSTSSTSAESTTPEIASSSELVDVDALRQEYLQLRDELFKSRARASTLSSQLYTTKISIRFAFTSGRHYGVNKATIRLDGASVFDDAEGAVASDDALRFEGYVAPGKHLLTFRIETTGKDDDRFTAAQEVQVALQAVANKDLVVVAKARDGGDIAYEWKKGEKGSYGLGIDVQVKTQKRDAKAAK
jgi:hypothetical protein